MFIVLNKCDAFHILLFSQFN